MPRKPAELTSNTKISDYMTVSLIFAEISFKLVRSTLKETGKERIRLRSLPNFILLYYIIALSMFIKCSTLEVHRLFFESIAWMMRSRRESDIPEQSKPPLISKSAISQARSRLGSRPVEALFYNVLGEAIGRSEMARKYREWYLVGLSSGTMETVNNLDNYLEFTAPECESENCSMPQIKYVSLVEHGSRLIFAANAGSCLLKRASLCSSIINRLTEGMLCLADKSFYSFDLWQEAISTGAKLLWEIGPDVQFSIGRDNPDSSCTVTLLPPKDNPDDFIGNPEVRMIACKFSQPISRRYLLITNLLDYKSSPAIDLAELVYHRLIMEETTDILRSHLNLDQIALRSKTPDLVRQEFYGLLLATYIAHSSHKFRGI